MGFGEVGNMNIVADAGAVGGGVIVAIDADSGAAAESDIEDEGNEMGLGFVGFAADDGAIGTLGRAGYVEIAERGTAETVDEGEPGQHALGEELGLAVGVGGSEFCILLNWNDFRLSVDGSGGGEDEPAGAGGDHGFEERKGGSGVIAEEGFGVLHGLAGFDEGSKVHDAIKRASFFSRRGKEALEEAPIGNFAVEEVDGGREQVAAAMAEIVENEDLVSSFGKQTRNGNSDVTCASGYQNPHEKRTPLRTKIGYL